MPDRLIRAAIDEAVAVETTEQKLSALVKLRESVLKERRLLRFLTVLSILLSCLSIGLGIRADEALDAFIDQRTDARVTSCVQFNEQQLRSRDGDVSQTRLHFDALAAFTAEGRTPDEAAAVDAFLEGLYEDQERVGEESYPLRDCTTAGIRAYFEEKTP